MSPGRVGSGQTGFYDFVKAKTIDPEIEAFDWSKNYNWSVKGIEVLCVVIGVWSTRFIYPMPFMPSLIQL